MAIGDSIAVAHHLNLADHLLEQIQAFELYCYTVTYFDA